MTAETMEKRDRLAELDENGEFPAMWNPEVGDQIRGTVRRYTQVELEKSGLTWLCVVEHEDSGEVETIFLSSTVLKGEFARQRPRIGEKIVVKYLGVPQGKSYKKYVLRVCDRPETHEPDWDDMEGPGLSAPKQQAVKHPEPERAKPAPEYDPNDPFADADLGDYAKATVSR